jgi:hypothetical protein
MMISAPRDLIEHQIWIRCGDDASDTRFISADTEMRVEQQEISDLTNSGLNAFCPLGKCAPIHPRIASRSARA